MLWLIILVVSSPGPLPQLTEDVARYRFLTEAECMEDAGERVDALKSVGMHGTYLCYRLNFTRAELSKHHQSEF